jgi:hypothetical protein
LQFDSLSAAAAHMGVDATVLQQDIEQYNAAAATNKDALGKQYFPTTIDAAGVVWVGQITPVVHYTMGGLKINEWAQVCSHWADTAGRWLAMLLTTNALQRHDSVADQLPGQKCFLCAKLLLYHGFQRTSLTMNDQGSTPCRPVMSDSFC